MKKANGVFAKFLSVLMALVLTASSLHLVAFSADHTNQEPILVGDSHFVLANPDLYQPDDDTSEAIYEEEKANCALRLAREEYSDEQNEASGIEAPRAITEPGDPWVFRTQRWLNQQYGSISGFGSVEENGKTGWNVIYGLLRALQIELGISSPVNSFGPTTSARYSQNILRPGVTDRKVCILIGTLLCKGYHPGSASIPSYDGNGQVIFHNVFNTGVENAVKELKKDAGFLNPNGDVTLNVMKALMSMDTFKLLSSYGGKAPVREMQQKFNRKYEAYIGIIPCDGVYARGTNKALIYALQAEEGLPVGTANGNFGPTTRNLAPQIPYTAGAGAALSYQGNYYSAGQISAFTELLQFSLYLNGFGNGVFHGSFDSNTKINVRDFQTHYALPVTGTVNLDTWMSLFLSSGNTSRPALAADCATILDAAKAKTLYDNGYRYIGRYLTGTYGGGINKALSVTEANCILNAGLRFFPIYQQGQYSANADPDLAKTYFTAAQAEYDANAAITAASALGIPKDTIIYFAVDFDAMDAHITSHIIPYFQKVNELISHSNYKTGIYGTRNVCSRVAARGLSVSSFVAGMSTGWSGNLGFKIPDNWAFSQIVEYTLGGFGVDKDAFSGRDQGVSQLNTAKKKAVYVLPGYMASRLYTSDGEQFFISGTEAGSGIITENIPLLTDILRNALHRKTSVAMLNSDGSGSKLAVNPKKDAYGSLDTYKPLIEKLTEELGGSYEIEFFPYNWLGDLNDSVRVLEQDIKNKGYSEVVFVTHSTGGLLASAYIARYNQDINLLKPKVTKAILVAAPLLGTYASLAPLEIGVGALLGQDYKIAEGVVQAIQNVEESYYPSNVKDLLGLVADGYDAAKNWVKDVTHNSPTTYQLLPSKEYLDIMPQLKENKDVFQKGTAAVTSADEYYRILNGSQNINPNLTNGNNRSHEYFRETVLGGDVVKTLQGVNTVLIASESAGKDLTPAIASYVAKGDGKTKLKEIIFKPYGDSTVTYASATANMKEGDTNIKIIKKSDIKHTALISDSKTLQEICDEIRGIEAESVSSADYANEEDGISNMIKINYSCTPAVSVRILDSAQKEVAKISSDDYFGFDGGDFTYYSYADVPEVSDATIYMPNYGYKIVFQSGNEAGETVDFSAEVSTLKADGLKDVSVTASAGQTLSGGVVAAFDGTENRIENTNISTVVSGTVTNHFTDWEIPDSMKLSLNDVQAVDLTGGESAQAAPLLSWSSGDESVATVSQAGVLTAVGYGKTAISATDGNKTSVCQVVVTQNAGSVHFPSLDMFIGEQKVIAPVFAPVTATETEMTYTYDKASVIRIDANGVIHALAAGTVTVTGTTDYGVANTFTVTVIDPDFTRRKGDVNGDGQADVTDLVQIKRHIAGLLSFTGIDFTAADVNGDGVINAADIIKLKKILLGINEE